MAEKEVNNVEQVKQVEEEKIAETEEVGASDGSYELVEFENGEGNALDEVDAKDTDNVVPKRKKSGILGRLSSTRKKKKKSAKEEITKEEPAKEETADEGKNDSNVALDDKADDAEEKTEESDVKSDKPDNEQQEEQPKEEEKQETEVVETENADIKPKKKPGRLRRLSFSKMKKSKKQSKKENKDDADMDGIENKDEDKENLKSEEKDEENSDSTKVQNVQEKCDLPETDSQSEHSNQPIAVDIEVVKEKDLENENTDINNKSYLSAVVHMPSDIAQKALQTIKQVFKPVIIYIIKKNPHCFKDIIDNNKNNKKTVETQL